MSTSEKCQIRFAKLTLSIYESGVSSNAIAVYGLLGVQPGTIQDGGARVEGINASVSQLTALLPWSTRKTTMAALAELESAGMIKASSRKERRATVWIWYRDSPQTRNQSGTHQGTSDMESGTPQGTSSENLVPVRGHSKELCKKGSKTLAGGSAAREGIPSLLDPDKANAGTRVETLDAADQKRAEPAKKNPNAACASPAADAALARVKGAPRHGYPAVFADLAALDEADIRSLVVPVGKFAVSLSTKPDRVISWKRAPGEFQAGIEAFADSVAEIGIAGALYAWFLCLRDAGTDSVGRFKFDAPGPLSFWVPAVREMKESKARLSAPLSPETPQPESKVGSASLNAAAAVSAGCTPKCEQCAPYQRGQVWIGGDPDMPMACPGCNPNGKRNAAIVAEVQNKIEEITAVQDTKSETKDMSVMAGRRYNGIAATPVEVVRHPRLREMEDERDKDFILDGLELFAHAA